MARIRTIKPEFFTSEDIVSLSPLARLLYVALWCEADREGRMAWKPRTFKLRYLPADNCSAEDLCAELIAAGLVVLYEEGAYAYIPKFARHQHINPRESESTLPEPDAKPKKSTRQPRVTTRPDASARDDDAQGGRERKGKEGVIQPPHPPASPGGAFDAFWQQWPKHQRKVARDQCERKWQSRGCEAVSGVVLAALEVAKKSQAWARNGGEFIPAPLVGLNQKRWEAPTEEEAALGDPWETAAGVNGIARDLGMPPWDECCEFRVFKARVKAEFDRTKGEAA